ncbi:MAG: TspO/MBR family protein [Weeksellaceae bacterium]
MQKLFGAIFVTFLASFIGTLVTIPSIPTWYAALNKPMLNPPDWVFGPVWTTLYLLMSVALYLVWKKGITKKNLYAVQLYMFQLVLNVLWSVIFFGLHLQHGGFGAIVTLWIVLLLTIIEFRKHSKQAAWLMLPTLLWVSFAAYLNFEIACMNN